MAFYINIFPLTLENTQFIAAELSLNVYLDYISHRAL